MHLVWIYNRNDGRLYKNMDPLEVVSNAFLELDGGSILFGVSFSYSFGDITIRQSIKYSLQTFQPSGAEETATCGHVVEGVTHGRRNV